MNGSQGSSYHKARLAGVPPNLADSKSAKQRLLRSYRNRRKSSESAEPPWKEYQAAIDAMEGVLETDQKVATKGSKIRSKSPPWPAFDGFTAAVADMPNALLVRPLNIKLKRIDQSRPLRKKVVAKGELVKGLGQKGHKRQLFATLVASEVKKVVRRAQFEGCFEVRLFEFGGCQVIWDGKVEFPFDDFVRERLAAKAADVALDALDAMESALEKEPDEDQKNNLRIEGFSKAMYQYSRTFYIFLTGKFPRPCLMEEPIVRRAADAAKLIMDLPEPLSQTYKWAMEHLAPKMRKFTPAMQRQVMMQAIYQNQLNMNWALSSLFIGRSSKERSAINQLKNCNRTNEKKAIGLKKIQSQPTKLNSKGKKAKK